MNSPNIGTSPSYYQEDEITLKDVILSIRSNLVEIWKHKFLVLFFITLFTAAFIFKSLYIDVTTYSSAMSFMVSEEGSNEQGNVYGPFEFGHIESNKITELARSGRIIHKVLLTKIVLNGRRDYLANHLISIYNLHSIWAEENLDSEYEHMALKDFYFTRNDIDNFSPKEYRALNYAHQLVAGNNLLEEQGIMSITYNDLTEIFSLNIEVRHETLALELLENIFEELKNFYIEETIGRTKRTFDLVKAQADSLLLVLSKAERDLGVANDRNRGFTSALPGLNLSKLQRERDEVNDEYTSVLKNKKSLELLLSKEMPEFTIIDRTFLPIKNEPSLFKSILLGGFLGCVIGMGIVMLLRTVRRALSEE